MMCVAPRAPPFSLIPPACVDVTRTTDQNLVRLPIVKRDTNSLNNASISNRGGLASLRYTNDDNATTTDYFWNFTGNVAYKGETGVWMNEGYPAHSVGKIWSSVWGVGTYRGARWFGWYECGESVKVTEAGIPWIVADDKDLASDATFTALAEEKMDALGLLASGAFTTYRQSDDCDYVWHHVKADVGSEEDDTYVRASGASGA